MTYWTRFTSRVGSASTISSSIAHWNIARSALSMVLAAAGVSAFASRMRRTCRGCIIASGAAPLSLAAISSSARFCQPCVEASSFV
ncbi:hypothetical protein [Methylobacterium brachiatum]|uniref:Secreted protein n=1 Tax=Methylobacterium brachiatum TaxID=269660 RepID=A0ABV1RB91_9HYPH